MLVAFAGFGGAGKTTAIEYLERGGLGRRVYLGQAVLDEIARCGLEHTAEMELRVRMELRDRLGPSAFAQLRAPQIEDLVRQGSCPLVDAIFKLEEYDEVRGCGQNKSFLLAIEASFDTRSMRLANRANRPLTVEELRERDRKEQNDIGMPAVLAAADFIISNEGSIEDLCQTIDRIWKRISA
jgi:dephospho-CoA kinase